MKWDWVYSAVLREEGWAGNYGGPGSATKSGKGGKGDAFAARAGKAEPGRMIGGSVEAETEEDARAQIKALYSKKETIYNRVSGEVEEVRTIEPNIEYIELTKKTAIITL